MPAAGARFVLVAHADEGHQRAGHVAHPGREIDAVRQCRYDQAIVVASRPIGFAALRHAEHHFTLPPQLPLLFIGEDYRGLDPPPLHLGNLTLDKLSRSQSPAPRVELACRLT
jgi:hypothetical protein